MPPHSSTPVVATQLEDDGISDWSCDSQDDENSSLEDRLLEYDKQHTRAIEDWLSFFVSKITRVGVGGVSCLFLIISFPYGAEKSATRRKKPYAHRRPEHAKVGGFTSRVRFQA